MEEGVENEGAEDEGRRMGMMEDSGRRTRGWLTGVDGWKTGDGRRGYAFELFFARTIALSIVPASMLFHWRNGQKCKMYVCPLPTFLRGVAIPACQFSRDYS